MMHILLRIIVLLAVLLTCLPACAPSTSTPLPTPDPVTRITFLADVHTWNYYRQLADTFNARQSAIHVTVLNPDEAAPKRFLQSPEERLAKLAAAADVFLSDALDPAPWLPAAPCKTCGLSCKLMRISHPPTSTPGCCR